MGKGWVGLLEIVATAAERFEVSEHRQSAVLDPVAVMNFQL
jgi:hypothetical protein